MINTCKLKMFERHAGKQYWFKLEHGNGACQVLIEFPFRFDVKKYPGFCLYVHVLTLASKMNGAKKFHQSLSEDMYNIQYRRRKAEVGRLREEKKIEFKEKIKEEKNNSKNCRCTEK